jgi:hypothetical protein
MNTTIEKIKRPEKLLEVDDDTFRTKFNQSSFMVSHQLATNPLFEFDRLFHLLKAGKSNIYWNMGDIKVNQTFKEIKPSTLSVDEAFSHIESSNAWLIFRSVQRDPDYRALLENFIAETEARSGLDFQKCVKVKDAIIFVTSPRRVATYHIDKECSFLLQIRGSKTAYVFDRNDREVIPEDEIERSWALNNGNNATCYKEQFQHRAYECHLVPGNGVHIPVGSPHWVKNGDNVSISLNINVHFQDSIRANVYRANYILRRAGLRPMPPGQSKARDAVKRTVVGGIIRVRRLLQGRPSETFATRKGGPVWK